MQAIADADRAGDSTTSTTPTSCRPSTSRNRGWSASRSSTEATSRRSWTFRSGPTERLARSGAAPARLRPHHAQAVGAGRDPDRARRSSPTRSFRCWPTGTTAWARRWRSPATPASRRTGRATGPEPGGMYAKFWEQVVDWSLRPTESSRLQMTTEYRDGKIHITVDARDGERRAGHEPDSCAAASRRRTPAATKPAASGELRFVQTNSGQYEARSSAEESGSYFVNAQAVRGEDQGQGRQGGRCRGGVDSVRRRDAAVFAGVLRAGDERAAAGEAAARSPAAQSYADDDDGAGEGGDEPATVFRPAGQVDQELQPVWQWLLFLAACCCSLDVAVRRIVDGLAEGRRCRVADVGAAARHPAAAGPAGGFGAVAEPQGRAAARSRSGGAALRGDRRSRRRRRPAPTPTGPAPTPGAAGRRHRGPTRRPRKGRSRPTRRTHWRRCDGPSDGRGEDKDKPQVTSVNRIA